MSLLSRFYQQQKIFRCRNSLFTTCGWRWIKIQLLSIEAVVYEISRWRRWLLIRWLMWWYLVLMWSFGWGERSASLQTATAFPPSNAIFFQNFQKKWFRPGCEHVYFGVKMLVKLVCTWLLLPLNPASSGHFRDCNFFFFTTGYKYKDHRMLFAYRWHHHLKQSPAFSCTIVYTGRCV